MPTLQKPDYFFFFGIMFLQILPQDDGTNAYYKRKQRNFQQRNFLICAENCFDRLKDLHCIVHITYI